MTITLTPHQILVEGHSSTKVCSAVSCLTQTLHQVLLNNHIEHYFEMTNGYTNIQCDINIEIVNRYFDFVVTGLLDMAKSYPKDITIASNVEQ